MGLLDRFKKDKQVAVKDMTPEQLAEYVKEIEDQSAELEKYAESLDVRENDLTAREEALAKAEKSLSSNKTGRESEPAQTPKKLTEREKQLEIIEAYHPFAASVRLNKLSDEIIQERYETACEIKKTRQKK